MTNSSVALSYSTIAAEVDSLNEVFSATSMLKQCTCYGDLRLDTQINIVKWKMYFYMYTF